MIIRRVAAQDRAAWDVLFAGYADFYGVTQTPQMRDRVWGWIHDDAQEVLGFVAERDGALIGFAHVRSFSRPLAAATGLFLDDLYVSQAARGSGAAQALLAAVRDLARAEGHSVVRWITARDNARARKVYDATAAATQWVTYDMDVPAR